MLNAATADTKDCLPDEKTIEAKRAVLEPALRLSPVSESHIVIPTINLSEYLTTQSICLNAYEDRIGVKTPGEQLYQNLFANFRSARKGGTKRARNESLNERPKPAASQIDGNDNCVPEMAEPSNVNTVVDQVVSTLLALQSLEPEGVAVKAELAEVKAEDEEQALKRVHDIERIRKGWTAHDCGMLSIGDLYLMVSLK